MRDVRWPSCSVVSLLRWCGWTGDRGRWAGGSGPEGRPHSERARLTVTRAIKAALAGVSSHHPSLGRHPRSTIRTGRYYSCSPDPRISIDWQL